MPASMPPSIQDRTPEFRSILQQAQKRLHSTKGSQRRALLAPAQKLENDPAGSKPKRSEFARRAAEIGRGITATTAKLQRLAQLAKQKTLFDDRPVEISELTFIIKQDLASLNKQIAGLAAFTHATHPKASRNRADQEGEHNDNVVVMLQGKLADVGANFKEVLEVRTSNIQASRSRTENFVSSVSARSHAHLDAQRSDSPLYQPGRTKSPAPNSNSLLTLDEPSAGNSALFNQGGAGGQMSDQQMLIMEEGQTDNSYIQARGEAIDAIERTITELGSIFGQLATMVSEQSEMIQRIDANTEDVVDNVQGAQRELLKYWSRVSGNRWLIAKMFGVLMIFFLIWVLVSG
ncbi:oligosaccharyl transferase glycoprotein complex, beta subunit [Ascosphaera pollenicola]|nr:oligosaccharyl transferase glycoprotein complex, beta subunit [Ascosphaera pollenicola]